MGHGLVPPVFPPYVHNDPRRSFEAVVDFIVRSVEESVPDTVRRFVFQEEGERFSLAADPAWSRGLDPATGVRLALAVRSDAGWTDDQAVAWGENAVIGGRPAIELLLARRILGLGRTRQGRVGDLKGPRGVLLFELERDAECLAPGDDLVVIGTAPGLRPAALHLYLIEPDAQKT
jgi:predicted component of type VI protein secretion system